MNNRFENKPRVYLAGPLTASHPLGYIYNIAQMENVAVELWKRGYPCFVPGEDFLRLLVFCAGNERPDLRDVYDNSMEWLKVCDVVYVVGGELESKGVQAEIEKANELGIPVVRSISELEELTNAIHSK